MPNCELFSAILANMSAMEDADKKVEMVDRRRQGLEKQILAREAHLFVEGKVRDWNASQRHEPLCRLPPLLQQPFFQNVALGAWTPTEYVPFWGGTVTFDRYSLGFLGPRNGIRVFAVELIENRLFEAFIVATIVLSTLMLVVDSPAWRKDAFIKQSLATSEPIFMIIFTAEFLLKAIAYGMYTTDNIELQLQTPPKLKALTLGDIGPPPLLHDSWAYIDMTVLLVSYISYFLAHVLAQIGADGALKIIRLLRAIRPLRIVNRSPGMRVVIIALQKSGPGVANVLLLIFFTFLIFAIVATDICGGYFFACTDGTRVGYTDCMRVHKNANGVVAPRVWRNPHIHAEGAAGLAPSFDNVGRGFLLLFEVATLISIITIYGHITLDSPL
jgi:hypothetical protein